MFFSTLQEAENGCRSVTDILSSFLSRVKPLSNGWITALCPFHNDSNSSFSVHSSSGNWKCFACEKKGSFFELPGCPSEHTLTDIYRYCDDVGIKYLKMRYFPKTFRIMSVKEDGSLIVGLNGQRALLYNWHKVSKQEGDVYLVEGEKDVDTLTKAGYLAVTNGSSSGWIPEFAQLLKDRKVILIPDNDQAGRAWMHTIMDTLKPYSVLGFPDAEVKDVTDWVSRGNALSGLLPNNSVRVSSATEIIDLSEHVPEPKKPEIWGTILPYKHVTLLYGDGGQGKSLFSLMLAYHVTSGKSFLGRNTLQVKTLYLDWELDKNEHTKRAHLISKGLGDTKLPQGLYYYRANADITQIMPQLREAIEQKDIGLIIIDSCGPASPGDLNSSEAVIKLFHELEQLDRTVLIIDHESKMLGDQVSTKPFGSVYKYNLSRSVLKIVKEEELATGGKFRVMQFKNNFGKLIDPLKFKVDFTPESIRLELV